MCYISVTRAKDRIARRSSDDMLPNDDSTDTTAALTEAATAAGFAPSVHNTQPWLWRVQPDSLHLRAARERQLQLSDPRAGCSS